MLAEPIQIFSSSQVSFLVTYGRESEKQHVNKFYIENKIILKHEASEGLDVRLWVGKASSHCHFGKQILSQY